MGRWPASPAGHGHAETAKLVHGYLARLDPDGPEPDPTAGRSFVLATHPDGRVTGRFDLDPVGGEKVRAVIESHVQADRPAGDDRTLAQRRADALVQWADTTLATGNAPLLRTVKPHVALKVGLEDLLDPATGPAAAELGFGAVLLGGPGPLDRLRRRPHPAARPGVAAHRGGGPRRALRVRQLDRAVPLWCEVHHLIHWALGGELSLANSGLLCERHHTQVHHGFRVERDRSGGWHSYRPDGSEIHVLGHPEDDTERARAG